MSIYKRKRKTSLNFINNLPLLSRRRKIHLAIHYDLVKHYFSCKKLRYQQVLCWDINNTEMGFAQPVRSIFCE